MMKLLNSNSALNELVKRKSNFHNTIENSLGGAYKAMKTLNITLDQLAPKLPNNLINTNLDLQLKRISNITKPLNDTINELGAFSISKNILHFYNYNTIKNSFSELNSIKQNMIAFNELVDIQNALTDSKIKNLLTMTGLKYNELEFNSFAEEYDSIASTPNQKDKAKFIAYKIICVVLSCILTVLYVVPLPFLASVLKDITEIYIKELGHDKNIKNYLTVFQEKMVKSSLSAIDKKRKKR